MISWFKRYFLNEKQIFYIIILSSLVIFLQQCFRFKDFETTFKILSILDALCTLIFTVEMLVKIQDYGLKGYLKSPWNVMDAILVIISLPAIISWILPRGVITFAFMKVLRVLRIFRFIRLIRIFPNLEKMITNFAVALRRSSMLMTGMVIFLLIFSIIGSGLFGENGIISELFRENGELCREDEGYDGFKTPLDSIYTTFRLFSGEGWNEIPDSIAEQMDSPAAGYLIRLYFSFLLILGCFIGMSMLNSIFVDAMVSDDKVDLQKELEDTRGKLADIEEKLNRLLASTGNNPTTKE